MIVSDTVICINLANLLLSFVLVLVILILASVVAFQYDYGNNLKFQKPTFEIGKYYVDNNGDIETFCNYFFEEACFKKGDKEVDESEYSAYGFTFTNLKKSDEMRRGLSENSFRQLYNFDTSKSVSDALKHGKRLSLAGYILSLVDIIIRIIELFGLCCGNSKRCCRNFLKVLVIISLCCLIGYLICFSVSYNRFKNIKSISNDFYEFLISNMGVDEDTIEDEIENKISPNFHSFRKDIKNSTKILVGLITLSCICFPLLIITLIISLCCGGMTIVNRDIDEDEKPVETK